MIRLLPVVALTFFMALPAAAQTNDELAALANGTKRIRVTNPRPR